MLFRVFVSVSVFAFAALAQDTGTILGTISDPSGAAISGVNLELLDVDRDIATKAVSGSSGEFLFSPVRIGKYELKASKVGFSSVVRSNLSLDVQQRMRVDLTLQVGSVGQSIDVTAESPLLETGTSSVGQVIANKSITELPLNGRDYQQLAVMTSGAVPTGQTSRSPSDFSANGTRPLSNNFLLDGVDNNSYVLDLQSFSSESMAPSIDALQEFKVQNNNFSAEFGRYGGAVINATIKSGANQFHGVLFEFLRNSALDANNFFNNRAGRDLPPFRQNQFGGTLGGPILRNRLFFFGSYQGTRIAQGVTAVSVVPTANERSGIFSSPVYDPATTRPNPNGSGFIRDLFPGNQIPANRFDAVGLKLLNTYPLPNVPSSSGNYILNPGNRLTGDQYDNRVDFNISASDLFFARYSLSDSTGISPGPLPAPASGQPQSAESPTTANSAAIGETHTFSPRIVNEIRAGLNRLDTQRLPQVRERIIEQFGFQGIPFYSDITGLPAIGVTGYQSLGENSTLPNVKLSQVIQITDGVSIIQGRHSVKVGVDLRYIQSNAFTPSNTRASLGFSGAFTQNPQSRAATGSGVADLLLGIPSSAGLNTPTVGNLRQRYYGFYLQDDWQVTRKLALNLGLRWDLSSPFWDHHDRMSNFIVERSSPDFGKFVLAGSRGDSIENRALVQFDKTDFSPRFGFAYRPAAKLVVRGAYGLFNVGTPLLGINARLSFNPPFNAGYNYTSDQTLPKFNIATAFPPDALNLTLNQVNRSIVSFDPNMTNGYLHEWNLGVEDEFLPNLLATVTYSASAGHHLPNTRNINQPRPGAGAIQPRSPFPQFVNISRFESDSNSIYNSLQAKLERRFASGLTFLLAYTWSHFIDNAQPILDLNGSGIQDSLNMAAERGNSNYDVRHRLVTSYAYELPWGAGRRFLTRKGVIGAIAGGWQLNGILSLQSGNPFTPTLNFNAANAGGSQRPDRLASGVIPYGDRTIDRWFDVPAFAAPNGFAFGNSGRNILTGPRLFQWDSSLFRVVSLRENVRLQFRAEFFNILNHPNFGTPNSTIGTKQAGTISSTVTSPRQIQFALKLVF